MAVREDSVSLHRMMKLEMELEHLRKEQGIESNTPLWIRAGDWLVNHIHEPRKVSRRNYLGLAVSCGWFCGAHQFYAGHKVRGILYLLFCWTCVPLGMTVIDILVAVLRCCPDENKMIQV